MLKRLALPAGLLSAVLWIAPAGASHSWDGFHWARASNPFTVRLVDAVQARWNGLLGTSSADWTRSTVLDTTITAGSDDLVTRLLCLPSEGRVLVCNATYGPNGWLGLATVWVEGEHITMGSVQVNDTYFDTFAQYNNDGERLHVICQEIGHTLGLGHQSESGANLGTCMDYSVSTSTSNANAHPNQHDYDQLVSIYSHSDSGGSSSAGTVCRVCTSASRTSVRVERFGLLTMVQFIVWA